MDDKVFSAMFSNSNNFTLRDYFAGQVLVGLGQYLIMNRDSLQDVAKSCYNIADIMIEVRNEKK